MQSTAVHVLLYVSSVISNPSHVSLVSFQLHDKVNSKLNSYFQTVEEVSDDSASVAIAAAQTAAAATASSRSIRSNRSSRSSARSSRLGSAGSQ